MREKDKVLTFRVSAAENQQIRDKMALLGIQNRGAYLRKMAIDGYCIKLELQEVKELVSLLRRCSNNLNQYAKKANATGNIYIEDIGDLQKRLDEIWDLQRELLTKLAEIT